MVYNLENNLDAYYANPENRDVMPSVMMVINHYPSGYYTNSNVNTFVCDLAQLPRELIEWLQAKVDVNHSPEARISDLPRDDEIVTIIFEIFGSKVEEENCKLRYTTRFWAMPNNVRAWFEANLS